MVKIENGIKKDGHVKKIKSGINRLETELHFAESFLEIYPDTKCQTEVKTARAFMIEHSASLSSDTIEGFISDCENLLEKTSALAKSITIHFVAHSHIDMNWIWRYDETVAITHDTFATILKLMDRFPDFTFSQSQASVYKIVEQYHPAMLEEIKKRVKEGRWEVSSVTWVEADKNMASGESQVRHILYTKRYFKELFGMDYDDMVLDFEPDTFGHSINVPSILSKAKVRYYYHCRGFAGQKLYRWQATDGSSIICYFEKDDWYNYEVTPEAVVTSAIKELKETGLKDILRVYGVGNHGGGPTIRDIENIKGMSSWPVFPTIKFSTYTNYFKKVDDSGKDLPIIKGEHNYVFTGCYTSQSEIKKANRYGEKNLMEAELFSSIAHRVVPGFSYPAKNVTEAWERLLFNQFHDTLPGSSRWEMKEYAMCKYQELMAGASSAKKEALSAIAGSINIAGILKAVGIETRGYCDNALGAGAGFWQDSKGISSPSTDDTSYRLFTVFNPSPFERSECVEVVLWDMNIEGTLIVRDYHGYEVGCQIIEDKGQYYGHTFKKILFEAVGIPPLGYKTFVVYEDPARHISPAAMDELGGSARKEKPSVYIIENNLLRIEFDIQRGAIKSLILKESNMELVIQGKPLALFRIIDEAPLLGCMTAWLIGDYAKITPIEGVKFLLPRAIMGPLRNGISWTCDVRDSRITTEIYVDKGSSTVHIDCKCDWAEVGKEKSFVPQLNIVSPLSVDNSTRLFEVPFGVVKRDIENMDVPVLRWADISGMFKGSDRTVGLTVVTDSKYGFRGGKDFLAVSLIRSSYDPDPYPEVGEHKFSISIIPHIGPCDKGKVYRDAITLDQPLIVLQSHPCAGNLPPEASFMEIKNKNVILSAFKKQEDGNSLIIRLYEVEGVDTEAEIKFASVLFKDGVTVTEADLMERKIGTTILSRNGMVKYSVPANGLVTLAVELAPKTKV